MPAIILFLLVVTTMIKIGVGIGAFLLCLVVYYILLRLGSLAVFQSKSDVNLATERRMINRILEKSKKQSQRKGGD